MNGLGKRLELLERHQGEALSLSGALREAFFRKVVEQADRYRGIPAPPIERQSVIEQCIRSALATAEGADGPEYVTLFWEAFITQARAHQRRMAG